MMEKFLDMKGKIALVTGSSRGIGKAIALELARFGCDVAVNCRHSKVEGKEVCRSIEEMSQRSILLLGDTRLKEDVERMVKEVESRLGHVDILVNNAVYALCKPFLEYTVEEWKDQLYYKGVGYFLTARRILPAMLRRGEGVIINILSTIALRNGAGELAYAATNGAAAALTRGLASEFGGSRIRVNGIMLTWADNAFDPKNPDHQKWLDRFPLGRVTKVKEVANLAAFLASPAASGITGALVPVDAGFLSR